MQCREPQAVPSAAGGTSAKPEMNRPGPLEKGELQAAPSQMGQHAGERKPLMFPASPRFPSTVWILMHHTPRVKGGRLHQTDRLRIRGKKWPEASLSSSGLSTCYFQNDLCGVTGT